MQSANERRCYNVISWDNLLRHVALTDQFHKSQNASVPCPTILHSEQNINMIISVMNVALWDMEQVQSGACNLGQLCSLRLFRLLEPNGVLRLLSLTLLNTLRPGQNGRHFADAIFKCIFLNKNVSIPIKISLKFVPKGPINNIPALVQIMAWRRPGDKPLFEPMMVRLPTYVCVTWPQWVNWNSDMVKCLHP